MSPVPCSRRPSPMQASASPLPARLVDNLDGVSRARRARPHGHADVVGHARGRSGPAGAQGLVHVPAHGPVHEHVELAHERLHAVPRKLALRALPLPREAREERLRRARVPAEGAPGLKSRRELLPQVLQQPLRHLRQLGPPEGIEGHHEVYAPGERGRVGRHVERGLEVVLQGVQVHAGGPAGGVGALADELRAQVGGEHEGEVGEVRRLRRVRWRVKERRKDRGGCGREELELLDDDEARAAAAQVRGEPRAEFLLVLEGPRRVSVVHGPDHERPHRAAPIRAAGKDGLGQDRVEEGLAHARGPVHGYHEGLAPRPPAGVVHPHGVQHEPHRVVLAKHARAPRVLCAAQPVGVPRAAVVPAEVGGHGTDRIPGVGGGILAPGGRHGARSQRDEDDGGGGQ
mmetsp:Transcript_5378/g.18206  ORF Transcript_5378/g.18206 Transcript_5378/m.18206 type:complete len:402 (+) Transcript_5378:156-1361(+)